MEPKQPLFVRIPVFRHALVATMYVGVMVSSLWLSLLLRFDFDVPADYWSRFGRTLLWLVPMKAGVLLAFGQFRSLLTFFSLSDALRLVAAMAVASSIALLAWFFSGGTTVVPRGVLLVDFLLSVAGLILLRVGMRGYREWILPSGTGDAIRRKRVAIIGAGTTGSALLREIRSKPGLGLEVVCFVDDDPAKIGGTLHGKTIEGPVQALPAVLARHAVSRAIIAMPSASPVTLRETVALLNAAGVEHDILPSVTQLLHKRVSIDLLRHVEPGDLLGRERVAIDDEGICELLSGKTVMVTGAGGSIGGELCRQVALHNPARILLVERSEAALFQIDQELRESHPNLMIVPLAVSVTHEEAMRRVFASFGPDIIFHAAAHKHVPLMEAQPAEAVFNNACGTLIVAKHAVASGASTFVLVSTDKAVNPRGVMGASKRLSEMVVSEIRHNSARTIFSVVRFGNVLGSSGSVVPIFRRQIQSGGPLRVTHPDATRFFMSLPEACGLILQSARLATGGEVFVLDMGEPVRIADLARQMVELSGLVPGRDIAIEFVGLRPGEKLAEEPIHRDVNATPSAHPRIYMMSGNAEGEATAIVGDLEKWLKDGEPGDARAVKGWLAERIPGYFPLENPENRAGSSM